MMQYNFEEIDELLYGDPCNDDNNYVHSISSTLVNIIDNIYMNKITLHGKPTTPCCISTAIYLHDKCNQIINEYKEFKISCNEPTGHYLTREYICNNKIIFATTRNYNRSSKLIATLTFIYINGYIIVLDSEEKIDLLIEYALRKVSTKSVIKI